MASNFGASASPSTPGSPDSPPSGVNCIINGVRYLYVCLSQSQTQSDGNGPDPDPRAIQRGPVPMAHRPITMDEYATAGPLDFPRANAGRERTGPPGNLCFPDISFEWHPPEHYVPVTPQEESPPVAVARGNGIPYWLKPNKIFTLADSGKQIEKIMHTEEYKGFRVFYVNLTKPNEYLPPDIQVVGAWEAYQLFPDIVREFFAEEKRTEREKIEAARIRNGHILPHFQETNFPIHAERIRNSVNSYEEEFPPLDLNTLTI